MWGLFHFINHYTYPVIKQPVERMGFFSWRKPWKNTMSFFVPSCESPMIGPQRCSRALSVLVLPPRDGLVLLALSMLHKAVHGKQHVLLESRILKPWNGVIPPATKTCKQNRWERSVLVWKNRLKQNNRNEAAGEGQELISLASVSQQPHWIRSHLVHLIDYMGGAWDRSSFPRLMYVLSAPS